MASVLVGSCSILTVHVDGVDAGDLFGRVEAISRKCVIEAFDRNTNWSSA
ncbi:hypothetical protein [Mycobacterium sp. 94-17]|nr:hypothetical protein [Mycobacterium sp. 94-17]MEB4207735.1 hypothetical protein [Mycobacterium sp. 94-17]